MTRHQNISSLMVAGLLTGGLSLALAFAAQPVWAQDDIVTWDTETYDTDELVIDRFAGTLNVEVGDGPGMTVEAFGPEDTMDRLTIEADGTALEIDFRDENFRWTDWSSWVRWWNANDFDLEDYPTVTVTLPAGTAIEVDNFTGAVDVGDTMGTIAFDAAGVLEGRIGNVSQVSLDIAGAADVDLGDVAGDFTVEISGAGDVNVGNTGNADVEINGAGAVNFATITGFLDASISGAGEVNADRLDGAADITISGTGSSHIAAGRAAPFEATVNGLGDIHFGGVAVNPDVVVNGMGDVYLGSYEGTLEHRGGSLTIGSDS